MSKAREKELKFNILMEIFAGPSFGIEFIKRLIQLEIIDPDTYEWLNKKNAATDIAALLKYMYDSPGYLRRVKLSDLIFVSEYVFNVPLSMITIKKATSKHKTASIKRNLKLFKSLGIQVYTKSH